MRAILLSLFLKLLAPQAPTADLTCTNATAAGGAATCSFTLPQAAAIRAVSIDTTPCEAHGDVFAFTAPVVDTLTADACFAPPGAQVELPGSPAGTQVSFDIRSGLPQYMTAVQVSGQYPEWTITVEDAVGAPFPPDFGDMRAMAPHCVSLADAEPVSLPVVLIDDVKTDIGSALHGRAVGGDR